LGVEGRNAQKKKTVVNVPQKILIVSHFGSNLHRTKRGNRVKTGFWA